jgi:hypothetical protein
MAKEKDIKTLDFDKDGKIRFYCRQKEYTFRLNNIGDDGKVIFQTDIDGNNKTATYTRYKFSEIAQFDPETKKVKVVDPWCVFEVAVDDKDAKRLVEYLTKCNGNKGITRIFTEAEYEEIKNPEAYRVKLESNKKDSIIAELEKEIATLKAGKK